MALAAAATASSIILFKVHALSLDSQLVLPGFVDLLADVGDAPLAVLDVLFNSGQPLRDGLGLSAKCFEVGELLLGLFQADTVGCCAEKLLRHVAELLDLLDRRLRILDPLREVDRLAFARSASWLAGSHGVVFPSW